MPAEFRYRVQRRLCRKVILCFGEWQSRPRGQFDRHPTPEFGMSVHTGSYRGPAQSQLVQPWLTRLKPRNALIDLVGPATYLLPQAYWHCVHEMCASGFHNVVKCICAFVERLAQMLQSRQKHLHQLDRRAYMYGRRYDVVG